MEELPKKSLGQHWLRDDTVLEAVCEAANVQKDDIVLEIGPGLGTLTDKLLVRRVKVVALEFDHDLVTALATKYAGRPSNELIIQEGDIRTYDFEAMPAVYKIVANIPYYLTSFLLRRLTESATHKPEAAALLVQKEVAERIAAGPGDLSVIAVATQFYYEVSQGVVVPAGLFAPPPKVDSQILILKRRDQPLFDIEEKRFFHLVRAGFSQRRKTLENSLRAGLAMPKTEAKALLESAGIASNARAQTLSLDEWYALYRVFSVVQNHKAKSQEKSPTK